MPELYEVCMIGGGGSAGFAGAMRARHGFTKIIVSNDEEQQIRTWHPVAGFSSR